MRMDHIETVEVSGPTEADQTEEDLYETAEQDDGEFEMHLSVPAEEEEKSEAQEDNVHVGMKSDNGLPGSGLRTVVQYQKRRAKRVVQIVAPGDLTASRRRKQSAIVAPALADERQPGQRPFQLKWLLDFEWLRFDPEKKKMYCNWCAECNKKNAFGKPEGTNNFRKSNCDEHTKSRDHQDAAARRSRQNSYLHETTALNETSGSVVTSAREADGSTIYQGSTITYTNPMSQSEIRFHAKKAGMLLSGLLVTKNLPPSLAKDFFEIMPFMFPDSRIAADLAGFH